MFAMKRDVNKLQATVDRLEYEIKVLTRLFETLSNTIQTQQATIADLRNKVDKVSTPSKVYGPVQPTSQPKAPRMWGGLGNSGMGWASDTVPLSQHLTAAATDILTATATNSSYDSHTSSGHSSWSSSSCDSSWSSNSCDSGGGY